MLGVAGVIILSEQGPTVLRAAAIEVQREQQLKTHRDDAGVIDIEDVLNSHGWHFCQEDAPQRICNGWVYSNHVKLHVAVVCCHDTYAEPLGPLIKVPGVVYAKGHVDVG